MKLKRIIASILCASVISTSVFAFTEYIPEPEQFETEDREQTDDDKQDSPVDKFNSFRPRDYEFQVFLSVLETYVENHLYDFTKEDVLYAFFSDFLSENPMYFEVFLDYMLGTMDPYSSFHKADSGFLYPESETLGFGLMVNDKEDGVYIESVIEGSSAHDAGFMDGDKFLSIAGINVEGQSFDIITNILSNPAAFLPKVEEVNSKGETVLVQQKNPKIDITVQRGDEKLTFNLSKGSTYTSQVSSYVDQNNGKPTAYIQVMSFTGDDTDKEFIELVRQYEKDGIKNLTIDLRDNGGGNLDYALAMAEIFLDNGAFICYYDEANLEEPIPIYSTNEKSSFDSVVILVNGNTASASELFTNILIENGIAKTVGSKSYGKGLGQTVYVLPNGDFVTVTSYQMLNKNKEGTDGVGIEPNIKIENIEICYELPSLGIFNHQNAKQIKDGEYSDVTKALEDRLVVAGLLREKYCDGIFDDITETALYVFQTTMNIEATGLVDNATVSAITKVINIYKSHSYYEDTQLDVAMIIHHSFSQGKRLASEKEKLREKETEKLIARDEKLNAERDASLG